MRRGMRRILGVTALTLVLAMVLPLSVARADTTRSWQVLPNATNFRLWHCLWYYSTLKVNTDVAACAYRQPGSNLAQGAIVVRNRSNAVRYAQTWDLGLNAASDGRRLSQYQTACPSLPVAPGAMVVCWGQTVSTGLIPHEDALSSGYAAVSGATGYFWSLTA